MKLVVSSLGKIFHTKPRGTGPKWSLTGVIFCCIYCIYIYKYMWS